MAGSVNKVILIGNLGTDPEVRHTQDGRSICNLSLATSETWRDKQSGERKERTEWHRVVIYNESLCKVAQQFLKKGSKVYLEGQLQTRKWQDNSGQDRYTTEVVLQNFSGQLTMLDGRNGASGFNEGGGEYDMAPSGPSGGGGGFRDSGPRSSPSPARDRGRDSGPSKSFEKELDDEIPF